MKLNFKGNLLLDERVKYIFVPYMTVHIYLQLFVWKRFFLGIGEANQKLAAEKKYGAIVPRAVVT